MKKYMSFVGQYYVPKNKLDDAVISYFKNLDRKIVNNELLEEQKKRIIVDIKKMNDEYPRCTPKEAEFRNMHFSEDIILDGLHVVEFKLLAGNETEVKP